MNKEPQAINNRPKAPCRMYNLRSFDGASFYTILWFSAQDFAGVSERDVSEIHSFVHFVYSVVLSNRFEPQNIDINISPDIRWIEIFSELRDRELLDTIESRCLEIAIFSTSWELLLELKDSAVPMSDPHRLPVLTTQDKEAPIE